MSDTEEAVFESPMDLRLKVVGVMMEPALTLAGILRLPLADVTQLVRTTYVRIGKRRGASVRALAKRFGVAPNTIQAIANVLRDHDLPDQFGAAVTRRRIIVQHLSEQPESSAEIVRTLDPSSSPDEMDEALDQLRQDGMVHVEEEAIGLAKQHLSIARGDPLHRLDSLRQMTETFCKVVYRRFFNPPNPGEAYGRVFTFACAPEDLVAIREDTYLRLSSAVRAADERATAKGNGRISSAMLVFVEEPDDPVYLGRKRS